MDKIWVKDVKEGEKVKSIFLVARKATPTAKSGKTYLALTLTDKTGELEARAFEKLEELGAGWEEKDVIEVEGLVGTFQGKPQLRLETVAKVDVAAAAIDTVELTWVAPPEPKKPEKPASTEVDDALWQELLVLVEAVTDTHVKTLIAAFLADDDFAARFRRSAAAKTVHHAYPGGLLEHTVATIKLAHRLADQYPQVDRDLLVAGAFFHDIGKVRELSGERTVEYTDEGKLVGHLVMTAQWIHDRSRRLGVPRELEHHLVHIVLAHHGKQEYGSPKEPVTLEALLVHYLDEIDSRVNSWLNLMGRDGGNRRWTDANNVYEQHIWRGTLPTVQAEKKGPPPEALTPVIYVPRDGGGGQAPRPKRPEKKVRPAQPRPDRPERSERKVEAPAAEGAAAPAAEGAPAVEARPEPRPERREGRPDRGAPPDRGGNRGPGSFGGPGDRKKGYTGPRLPGDRGPHSPPRSDKPKSLTHNPFAALAAKLEEPEAAKPAEAPTPQAPAAVEPAVPEAPPPAPSEGTGEPQA